MTLAGLALLVGAFIASNVMTGMGEAAPQATTTWLLASWAALIAGFFLFNAGLKGVAKWSRRPRRDEIIDNHLRRLNDRFNVFHYVTLGGRVYDHLVVHPGGLALLIVRDSFGPVSYQQGRWRRQASPVARFFNFAGPPVGNPHQEAATTAAALQEALHAEGLAVEVQPIIVFVHPRVSLTVDESPVPICRVEDLAGVVRERSMGVGTPGNTRLQLVKLLTAGIGKPDERPTTGGGKGKVRRTPTTDGGDRPARRGTRPGGTRPGGTRPEGRRG